LQGQRNTKLKKIAIVAGCGDIVDWMKDAEHNGADAYITGEIHCHIDNEYGRQKYREMKNFIPNTSDVAYCSFTFCFRISCS